MSDARRYSVWPDPRSRSRSRTLESWKSFHFQKLSPLPFTVGAGNWPPMFLCHVTWKLAETSVVKSRPSVPYGADLLSVTADVVFSVSVFKITRQKFHWWLCAVFSFTTILITCEQLCRMPVCQCLLPHVLSMTQETLIASSLKSCTMTYTGLTWQIESDINWVSSCQAPW